MKGERRLIDGPKAQHVFPIILDVVTSSMAGTDRQLDETRLRAGYLCRFCYREFEKLEISAFSWQQTSAPKVSGGQAAACIFHFSHQATANPPWQLCTGGTRMRRGGHMSKGSLTLSTGPSPHLYFRPQVAWDKQRPWHTRVWHLSWWRRGGNPIAIPWAGFVVCWTFLWSALPFSAFVGPDLPDTGQADCHWNLRSILQLRKVVSPAANWLHHAWLVLFLVCHLINNYTPLTNLLYLFCIMVLFCPVHWKKDLTTHRFLAICLAAIRTSGAEHHEILLYFGEKPCSSRGLSLNRLKLLRANPTPTSA